MSSTEADEVCASCGITGGDDVKLLLCTACKLIRYCSVECQKNHRPQHKKACKKKPAELYEEKLFKEHPPEECPICMLPLPIESKTVSTHLTKRPIIGCSDTSSISTGKVNSLVMASVNSNYSN